VDWVRFIPDTSVVLPQMLWRPARRIVCWPRSSGSNVRLFSSAALPEESAAVLGGPFASERLAIIGKIARDVLADYAAAVELCSQRFSRRL
jgi:hypothetical protein